MLAPPLPTRDFLVRADGGPGAVTYGYYLGGDTSKPVVVGTVRRPLSGDRRWMHTTVRGHSGRMTVLSNTRMYSWREDGKAWQVVFPVTASARKCRQEIDRYTAYSSAS